MPAVDELDENAPGGQPAGAATAEARPHTLKSDDSFAIFGAGGDMAGGAEGLYHRDTRHLSRLVVTIDGARPRLLDAAVSADNAALVCDRSAAAADADPASDGEADTLSLRVESFLWDATRHDRLRLTNWSRRPQTVTLGVGFAADFADLFEIRGAVRRRHGAREAPAADDGGVTLGCRGLDGVRRWTRIAVEPAADRIDAASATWRRSLAPGESLRVTLAVCCGAEADPQRPVGFGRSRAESRRRRRQWRRRCASVATGDPLADAALRRARDDLLMLTTDTVHGPYPYAGVPWFSTVFGRDALITALEVLWFAPGLARGVLAWLAANQAVAIDPAADSEPGKILHEARDGDMARCGEVPFRRYYGSVDATPLFVMLAGAYHERTGDTDFLRRLWPNLDAALAWLDGKGDADGDGFVEYGRKSRDGLVNQGWKDSHDAIFHADGTLARGPIALCEVQAYVFAAKTAAAGIAASLGFADRAAALAREALSLRRRFDDAFWDAEAGFYALALDGDKRPCRVLASNAGHALFAGIALPDRAAAVAARLMSPEFFSGWGIRTLARGQPRFNPISYHNGSVWPHDTALIGLGLARYGFASEAAALFDAMLDAALEQRRSRLPELFCGFPRRRGLGPTAYPVACAPQAWAAGALPALLDACAGPASTGSANPGAAVLPTRIARLEITPAPG